MQQANFAFTLGISPNTEIVQFMHIDHLEIKNFRLFQHLEIDFKPGVNLLVGVNQSGKTGLLEALCIAISGFFQSEREQPQRRILKDDVRIFLNNNSVVQYADIVSVSARSKKIGSWYREFSTLSQSNTSKGMEPMRDYGDRLLSTVNSKRQKLLPLIAYYSTQRLFTEVKATKKYTYDEFDGPKIGYLQALTGKPIRSLILDSLMLESAKDREYEYIDKQYIRSFLPNVKAASDDLLRFLSPQHQNMRTYFSGTPGTFRFAYANNPPLPIELYSDGFRSALFLVMDMVWRAAQLNRSLDYTELCAQTNGIVLIDEIDLHLHPLWQGKIIAFLQKLFPNVQYFISTHSPNVVANFERRPENDALFILQNGSIHETDKYFFGREVNDVQRNIFGASDRNPIVQQQIDALLGSIDKPAFSMKHFKVELQRLKSLLGAGDPELETAASLANWRSSELGNHYL